MKVLVETPPALLIPLLVNVVLQGYKQKNAYIATQAPLRATVEGFWRMIWEFKSKVIVMLCKTEGDGEVCEEGDNAFLAVMCYVPIQEACYQYWPEKVGSELMVGKLTVTLKSEEVVKENIVRQLEIKEEKVCKIFGGLASS